MGCTQPKPRKPIRNNEALQNSNLNADAAKPV